MHAAGQAAAIGDEYGPLLTGAEVAARFHVEPATVTRWTSQGKLTAIRTPGGRRRYREREVEALLTEAESPRLPALPALSQPAVRLRVPAVPARTAEKLAEVAALNADFGPRWHVWLAADGLVYAVSLTPADINQRRSGAAEHAVTAWAMRALLARRDTAEREAAALASAGALITAWGAA